MILALLNLLRDWLTGADLYRFVMVFDQLGFRAFGAGLVAFAVVLACGRPVIDWLRAKKIGDTAQFDVEALNEAMAAKANTPTMGGLLIAGAVLGATLLFADLSTRFVQLSMIVLLWHAALGGADDWLKLTAASPPRGLPPGPLRVGEVRLPDRRRPESSATSPTPRASPAWTGSGARPTRSRCPSSAPTSPRSSA